MTAFPMQLTLIGAQNKARFSRAEYSRAIRANVRGLWSGTFDVPQFFSAMHTAISRGFTLAWYDGAEECGISPEELSIDEIRELNFRIDRENLFVVNFANAIVIGSKANGGKLTPLFTRANLWINRYDDIKNHARVLACKDKKLIWELGATEEHCRTCNALHGKVKRASIWLTAGVRPQNAPNDLLECEGWNCRCTLTPTDLPMSRGRLPSLP
jgi:hypothetical protein